jgi:hypothetical protein
MNGAVSNVNKKCISQLTQAQHTPSAAAAVQVSHALIINLQYVHPDPEVRVRFPALPDSFFWEVVGLERGPLSLVVIIEELF